MGRVHPFSIANCSSSRTPKDKTPQNRQASPCHQELERRTEMGLAMHNMLAKGQVVPFSMTLELLKGVANLTCSEKLVIQNCPQQLGFFS